MPVARVLDACHLEIPAEVAMRHGLAQGQELDLCEADGLLVIVPAGVDPIERACGMFAGGSSMARQLVEDRRRDAARDK